MQRLPTTSTTTTDTGLELAKWLGGAAAGALLMYMLDPERGGARRAQSAAAVRSAGARTGDAIGKAWSGAGERIGAVADELIDATKPDGSIGSAISGTLSKARQAIGRAADAAGEAADDARAKAGNGFDALKEGAATAHEHVRASARGGVDQALGRAADAVVAFYDDSRKTAGRLGSRMAQEVRGDDAGHWGPALRNSALIGGGLLALLGVMRRSPLGAVLGLAGAALLARGAANQPLRTLAGRGAASLGLGGELPRRLSLEQTIDVEKTIHIDAAPDEVYDQFSNYENFPRYMSHVTEVKDLGHRRSHWIVKGPGGSRFEWHSVLTEQSRPHRLAWRSEAGAEVPNSGSIEFEGHRGGTLVTVRMSYTPPAGALGHGLAQLLGADPKSRMDEDLARMRATIERGGMPRGAVRSSWAGRFLH